MPDGAQSLDQVKDALIRTLTSRVNDLVEREKNPTEVASLLGGLVAARELTQQIARAEARRLRCEMRKDKLRERMARTDGDEATRLGSRMDEVQTQIDRLGRLRGDLTEHLDAVAQKLQA